MPHRKVELKHIKHLGNRVAIARKAYGHSQAELGKMTGIKPGDVSLIECGKSVRLLEEHLDILCKALKTDEDWLYEGLDIRPQMHLEDRITRLEYKIDLILHQLELQNKLTASQLEGYQPIAHPGSAKNPLPPTSR